MSRPAAFADSLGTRYHVPGPGGDALEVLAIADTLTAVAGFELAVRERARALAAFQHPAFARLRGVERLGQDASALALVSDRAPGARLSHILAIAEQQLLAFEIGAALHLIRQLVHAVAALHEQMHGICHGALTPERIVVSPNGRLIVVEHALGAALEQLHYPHERYWKELGIPLPNPAGTPRLDQRADILQVGAVALALVVGRPLYTEEFPGRIGALAERAWGLTASGGVEPLPNAVRTWLARALQLDARHSFASAVAARTELDRFVSASDQAAAAAALRTFLAEYATHAPAAPEAPRVVEAIAVPEVAKVPEVPKAPELPKIVTVSEPPAVLRAPDVRKALEVPKVADVPKVVEAAVAPVPIPRAPEAPIAKHEPAVVRPQRAPEPKVEMSDSTPDAVPWWRRRWIAASLLLAALIGGGTAAGRLYSMPRAAAEAAGTLVVETNPPGAAVLVDGKPRGFAPLTLTLSPGSHTLEVLGDGEARTIPLTMTAGGTVSQFIELPKTTPATTTGQLQVRTEPAGARVTVDGVLRGVTPLTIEALTAGEHRVTMANDVASVTHDVVVEAGATASLVVPMSAPQGVPVSGWIAVAAPVEVQVYENQRLLGTSRTDRIMVAVGRHELDIVHEGLGYRATRTVNVAPGQVTPVKLEWPMGSMALNAQPWADVWIDGERVGETPIGNVAVPIGTHEVLFRHPELGEHVVRATVTLTAPTRVSVDLRRP